MATFVFESCKDLELFGFYPIFPALEPYFFLTYFYNSLNLTSLFYNYILV